MYRVQPFTVKAKVISALVLEVSTIQKPYSTGKIF